MKGILTLTIIAAAGIAASQTVTAQSSLVNYDYLYGAGGDGYQGSDSTLDTSVLSSGSNGLDFERDGSGVFQGQEWTAMVRCNAGSYYEIHGDPNNFEYVFLSTLSTTQTQITGPALAIMNSSNPGILHTLDFSVGSTRSFHLFGNLELGDVPVGPGNVLSLQKFNGAWWESVHTSFSDGIFDMTLDLGPGQYRLLNQIGSKALSNEEWMTRGFLYLSSNPVPEPATLTVLSLGALILTRRSKRK